MVGVREICCNLQQSWLSSWLASLDFVQVVSVEDKVWEKNDKDYLILILFVCYFASWTWLHACLALQPNWTAFLHALGRGEETLKTVVLHCRSHATFILEVGTENQGWWEILPPFGVVQFFNLGPHQATLVGHLSLAYVYFGFLICNTKFSLVLLHMYDSYRWIHTVFGTSFVPNTLLYSIRSQ